MSKFFSPQRQRPRCILSRCHPHTTHNQQRCAVNTFLPNWWNLDWSVTKIGDMQIIEPKRFLGPLHGSPNHPSHDIFPFDNDNNTPRNQPNMFHPNHIAASSRMSLPSTLRAVPLCLGRHFSVHQICNELL